VALSSTADRNPDRAALAARVDAAISAASRTTRRSALTRIASRHRREDGLTTRCAWCGRYAVDGTFRDADELPRFVAFTPPSRLTHGICPECVVDLRREGKSR
jgi:hypothetical protein